MEMIARGDASYTNSFHVLDLPKKKKKKKKKKKMEELEEEETGCPSVEAPFRSPFPCEHLSLAFWQGEGEETEGDSTGRRKRKKKKKKDVEEIPDSRDESSWIVPESEEKSEDGVDLRHKKKKKKRHKPRECDGDVEKCAPDFSEAANTLPEEADLEGAPQDDENPPLKKKKKNNKKKKKKAKESFVEEAGSSETSGLCQCRKILATEWPNPNQTDHSDGEGSLELFPSSLPLCQDPSGKGENGVAGPDPPNSPGVPKKVRRRKKARRKDSQGTEDGLEGDETVEVVPEDNQAPDRPQRTLSLTHADAEEPSSPERPDSETCSLFGDDFLESFSTPAIDLESVRKELEEFIPHVRSLSDSAIRQLSSRDLERFRKFKAQGIAVKFGKFSKKEDQLLKRNIEAFLEESGIDTAEKLLFTHRFPEEKADINKLKSKHLFGVRIAEGIPRPWRLVYYRGRRLFDPQNYKGKFSEQEKKQLKNYQALYGNNWTKISELMGRSSRSVEQKFSNMRSDPKSGPWSEEETEKLIQSVAEVLRSRAKNTDSSQDQTNGDETLLLTREMIYKNIPWSQIEKEVGTRNWKQCRKKWSGVVAKRIAGGQKGCTRSESIRFRIKLIKRLNKLNVEEEHEINWEDVSSAMGYLPPNYLQSRYYRMKTAYVPFWNRKSFDEIIYYLHKKKLPQLKALVRQKATVQKAAAAAEADWRKEAFPFSFIFPHCSRDSPVDEEEELED
ncbi:hypothetical protein JRQ81_008508 [Phrynocephalus forsythii]|uniref:Transcription termination factor 1 n=1 Tax=Phrynocephalus forsythii TaxID=171643 RepID=A0A9Q0XAE3_9SAUR|nr:hypothetical protein JRQ81_008508 [Phrynocephalus forsythii]